MASRLARGILPALCTPFDDGGVRLETSRLKPLIDHLLEAGTSGLFICGGTGEGAAMSPGERRQMTESVVSAVGGAVPVIVQVGATTTADAVELARHAERAGADATASVAPVDRPNDLAAATDHYAAIGAASDLPFYVYWLQRQADQSITPGRYLEAMATVPNFAGLKYTDTNFYFFQQLIDLSDGSINALTGPDEMCLSGMVMGSDGSMNHLQRHAKAVRKDAPRLRGRSYTGRNGSAAPGQPRDRRADPSRCPACRKGAPAQPRPARRTDPPSVRTIVRRGWRASAQRNRFPRFFRRIGASS